MIQPQNITEYYIDSLLKDGDIAIDATAGNGNDTLKLCKAVGNNGKVFAFDIQKDAIDNTAELLTKNGMDNAELIMDSHANIKNYISGEVKAIVFNLGYLPGGNHLIHTKAESTIEALKQALSVMIPGGFCAVSIYYGKNSGTEEKDSVLEFLKNLDYKKYTVLLHDFFNRPNNPPLTAVITRN